MKILIINAYSKKNQNAFKQFERNIKRIFLSQKEFLDTETEFFIRDLNNLDDFLYELDSIYVSPESARLFNFLDMVFIQGESNLLPWSPKARKLLSLLRMCLLTQKILFASTCAMQCLVYLCATNFEKPITVINGAEGSRIEDFFLLHPENMSISATDLFLDCVTGDFYTYSSFSGQWMPIGNAGLHSNKAAQAFNSIGKYMIKAPVYKPQPRLDKYSAFLQRNYETYASIKKIHLQHWAMIGAETEFVVSAKNCWDVHPFNFVNPQRTFFTLAESHKGPILIEIGVNIMASQFTIEDQYPETLKIFRNFIQEKLKDITNMEESAKLLIEKVSESAKKNYVDPLTALRNETVGNRQLRMLGGNKSNFSKESYVKIRPMSAKTFSHVGFASKKSEMLDIIDNNAIQVNNLFSVHKKISMNNQSINSMTKNLGMSCCENFLKSEEDVSCEFIKEKDEVKSKVKSRPQTAKMMNFCEFEEKTAKNMKNSLENYKESHIQNKTSHEMRKMLHPNSKQENLPNNQTLWVPGNLSKTKEKQRIASASSVGSIISMKLSIILKPKYTLAQTLFSSYGKFKDSDLDECREKPIIRVSGPYMIEKKMEKEKYIKDKALNLGGEKFDLGKPDTNYIKNYVNLTLSEPPLNHKFREESKEKWVSKRNFRLC